MVALWSLEDNLYENQNPLEVAQPRQALATIVPCAGGQIGRGIGELRSTDKCPPASWRSTRNSVWHAERQWLQSPLHENRRSGSVNTQYRRDSTHMKIVAGSIALSLWVTLAGSSSAWAQDARPLPAALAAGAIRSGDASMARGGGENFGWVVGPYVGQCVQAYQAWKDPAWLDAAVQIADYAISKMLPGPDGYKGWVGTYGNNTWADVHVSDAILCHNMLALAELVLKDPDLKRKYGEAARKYVDLTQRDLFAKWDARGTWKEDGPYGGYVQWDTFCSKGEPNVWKKAKTPDGQGEFNAVSIPFNKQDHVGLCALRLYRITGDAKYRDKAQKIFAFEKSRMLLVDDSYYVWNYWEAFYPGDVDLAKKDTLHWMNVHGHRNYQAEQAEMCVEAYHTGLVFDKTDIERMTHTNLKVMWNGAKADPQWINSNGRLPEPKYSEEQLKAIAAENAAAPEKAGTLWTCLLDFDQTARDLYELRFKNANPRDAQLAIRKAYYENVTARRPVGFERRYCAEKDARVFDFPFHSCKSLTVATVLPSVVKNGSKAILLSKCRIPQEVEVALYSADGKMRVSSIYKGKVEGAPDGHAGILIVPWDPSSAAQSKPLQGPFRIRWTGVDGYREFPITVAP